MIAKREFHRMFKKVIFFIFISIIILGGIDGIAEEDRRIISLAPAITEIIFALEADDMLVGVTNYCDYPPEARHKEKVGGFINPNIEKILTLNPDVVILSPNSGTKNVQAHLAHLNIDNCVVQFYTINGLVESYGIIGEKIGRPLKARALRRKLEKTMRDISERLTEEARPHVLFVRSHQPMYVAGRNTYEDDVIFICGGINAITNGGLRYPHYTLEGIVSANPDIIIDATFYKTPNARQMLEIKNFWSPLKNITAVKNNNVYIIKTDIHSVPGPRTPQFLQIMARIIHPDVFGKEFEYSERI